MPTRPPTFNEKYRGGRKATDRAYRRAAKNDPRHAISIKVRNSSRWRKVRALKRQQSPLCEDCKAAGHINGRDLEVHHLVKPHDDLSLAYDLDNLVVLCRACHNRRHAAERRG